MKVTNLQAWDTCLLKGLKIGRYTFIQKISLSVSEYERMFFLSNILEKQLSSMDLHFCVFLLSFLVVM